MPEGEGEGECPDVTIDRAHLARQTFGDAALEREVLGMFLEQAPRIVGALAVGACDLDLAHTLKGSARAIGAWRVAAAAEAFERSPDQARHDRIAAAVEDACAVIRSLHPL